MGRKILKHILLLCIGLCGITFSFLMLLLFREELTSIYASPQALRAYVQSVGVYAPLLFIGLQVLQVVVFIIPGEIAQFAGGFLFGFGPGLLYTVVGIALGSSLNFFTARFLGKPVVIKIFGREKVEKFATLMDLPKAKWILFLLFLLPGFPKDFLSYVAGISAYKFPFFLMVSAGGRFPGILVSIYLGQAAAVLAWEEVGLGLMVGAVLIGLGIWVRGIFLKRYLSSKTGEPKKESTLDAE